LYPTVPIAEGRNKERGESKVQSHTLPFPFLHSHQHNPPIHRAITPHTPTTPMHPIMSYHREGQGGGAWKGLITPHARWPCVIACSSSPLTLPDCNQHTTNHYVREWRRGRECKGMYQHILQSTHFCAGASVSGGVSHAPPPCTQPLLPTLGLYFQHPTVVYLQRPLARIRTGGEVVNVNYPAAHTINTAM